MLSLKNININNLTPMMKQYYKIKIEAPDSILFYRLGDFYEMFFDDAIIASKVLGIALTGRDCGLEERAPMCGVPYHAATQYIKNLIDNGYKVAICEQLEDPANTKGIVERGIVKVFTPGTILDEDFLKSTDNNFISSIFFNKDDVSITFCDISTGELFVQEDYEINDISKIKSEIDKFNPTEILINNKEYSNLLISEGRNVIYNENTEVKNKDELINLTEAVLGTKNFDNLNVCTVNALYNMFDYLIQNKNTKLSHINKINMIKTSQFMGLDENAIKNLEICKTIYDGTKKGSLLSVIDKTVTPKGSRLLKRYIERPLINIDDIIERLDMVESFFYDPIQSEDIRELLSFVSDIERINAKIVSMIAGPRDLVNLKNTLKVVPEIDRKLNNIENYPCNIKLNYNENVLDLIDNSIVEEPPNSINDGNYIKEGYDIDLDEIRARANHSENILLEYENSLKKDTNIKNLRVKYNKVTGYFIEISKGQIDNVPDYFKRIQTLKNVERYTTSELAEIEYKILNASKESFDLEKKIYTEILNELVNYVDDLNELALNLAKIDCFLSLAEVARVNNYKRPEFNNDGITDIKSCRHPVVELNNNLEMFIPNDVYFDNLDRYAIITGPNMSGKSTYMRTIALNQILAQMGSFIPADYANLSIIDNIFTRIGASDSLNKGKSTFMVEMSEVSNILNNATKNSLIILDEVGRGTSTYDGMSIAVAVMEYIAKNIKAKTMFSTHYPELSDLENKIEGTFNLTLEIKETNNEILFLRKVVRGVTNKSYGIHVAKIAGLPDELIKAADNYQNYFSSNENRTNNTIQMDFLNNTNILNDAPKENESYNKLIEEIKAKDLNSLSPIEALNFLYYLKGEIND